MVPSDVLCNEMATLDKEYTVKRKQLIVNDCVCNEDRMRVALSALDKDELTMAVKTGQGQTFFFVSRDDAIALRDFLNLFIQGGLNV
jgi:hypothetical protein